MSEIVRPEILLPGNFNESDVNRLRGGKVWQLIDIYEEQLEELHEVTFPDHSLGFSDFAKQKPHGDLAGAWAYYPWSGILLHCVGPDDLFELRTNRNQYLVSKGEQAELAASIIGVAGMSVGSGIALACVYSGMSSSIKVADFDVLSTANLNRLRESLGHVGLPKVELAARSIFEINPFANVSQFEGVTEDNIDSFFGDPKLDLVIDEIDDFKMKVKLRLKAKQSKVPLLMFTSLGDNILIDVERYDEDNSLPIFNGRIGDTAEDILKNPEIKEEDMRKYAVKLVGPEFVPTRALKSLPDIGAHLVGRPQLYSTIAVDGGLAAYIARHIILGAPVKSGRYFVKFSDFITLGADDLEISAERQQILNQLINN